MPVHGYRTSSGRFHEVVPLTLAESALRATSSNGDAVELGDKPCARLTLDVTAKAGTLPTLDVVIQTSKDNITWYTSGAFTQATDVTSERKCFCLDRYVRALWTQGSTVAGTNSVVAQPAGEPVVAVGGAPAAAYSGVVLISTGGVRGTAKFDWYIDGGTTPVATGVSTAELVALGATGLVVAFDLGTYHVGATYSWTSTVTPANGAVTKNGTSPTITLTGTPAFAFSGKVKVDFGGDRGTATITWSIDGGTTWEAVGVLTGATVALGATGVTLNMPTGTYVLNDYYTWSSTITRANGAVTQPAIPAVGLQATAPLASYSGVIEIDGAGARGVATFKWSTDGGSTWLHTGVTTGATVALTSTGLTATFASGQYEVGDRYTWTSVGPTTDQSFTFSVTGEAA